MVKINKTLDGTLEKAIDASAQLSKMPGVLQDFMLKGDFDFGGAKKVKAKDIGISDNKNITSSDIGIQNLAAQLAGLDKSQQSAVFKMSDLSKEAQNVTQSLLGEAAAGNQLSGVLVDNQLKTLNLTQSTRERILQEAKLVDGSGKYKMATAADVKSTLKKQFAMQDCSEALKSAGQNEQQLATTIVATVVGQQAQTATTWAQKLALDALAGALAIGKQLLVSLAVTGIGMLIKYIVNLKTPYENLTSVMNDAHDAAEKAESDVDEIKSKIDDLNQKVKDAGADSIEDIVDPQEKAKLQDINDLLETQLKLKNQIADEENNKANDAASDVFNSKSAFGVVKKYTPTTAAEADPNGIGVNIEATETKPVAMKNTDALKEHSAYLEELSDSYAQVMSDEKATDQERSNAKKSMEDEMAVVKELGQKVSDNADKYRSNGTNYSKYSDEVKECTDSMNGANDALERANSLINGSAKIDTTNLDILLQKMQATKNFMDRRNKDTSNSNPYTGAVKTLKASGLETGDDIRELSAVPANQTKEQAAAINVLQKAADNAHVTLDEFISALESVGLIAVRNTSKVKSLSDAMSMLDNMQSAYQSCASAVKEYNKTGYVTMDTLQSLCQLEPQYLNMLDLKNGKVQFTRDYTE